jgi:hypothetical protein
MEMQARAAGLLLALATMVAAAAPALAQTRYVCRSGGNAYISNSPCLPATPEPSGGGGPGVVYYGPDASSQYRAPAHIPRAGEAPSHLTHMSPRCSSLNDALRTARVRGLASETITTMQRDYRRECGENEGEARAQFSQESREKAMERRGQQEAEKRERERASLHAQQCGESKRILFAKRARADLTEGEKAELKRFEENYRSRCG